MRKPEQNQNNYGVNPGRGSRTNNVWTNTDEHFSTGRDPESNTSSQSMGSDFDDEGLETRSHRLSSHHLGWDRAGFHASNPGLRGPHYGKGPKGYQRTDDRIKEDVCEVLYAHHEIDASEIEVSVKEGIITLSGSVESRNLKRQVESAIENLAGVEDVQNNLKVFKNMTPMSGTKDIGDVKSLRS